MVDAQVDNVENDVVYHIDLHPAETLRVPIDIGGSVSHALVDSGSQQYGIVTPEYFETFRHNVNLETPSYKCRLKTANNQPLNILHHYVITEGIKVEGENDNEHQRRPIDIIVTNDLSHEAILGTPFLNQNNVKLLFQKNERPFLQMDSTDHNGKVSKLVVPCVQGSQQPLYNLRASPITIFANEQTARGLF